jgi:RNA polymerase sigma-70 factor (ECF subfamily)
LDKHKTFNEAVKPCIDSVFKTIYLMSKNRAESEDILQETLYQAYLHFHKYDVSKASLTTWLKAIAFRQATKVFKKRKAYEVVDEALVPDESAMEDERTQMILWAMNMLDADQRMLVVMHYFDELEIKEMAQILEKPEGTVKSRLHAAREQIKIQISQKGGEG